MLHLQGLSVSIQDACIKLRVFIGCPAKRYDEANPEFWLATPTGKSFTRSGISALSSKKGFVLNKYWFLYLAKYFGKDGRILASGNIGNLGMAKLLVSLGVRWGESWILISSPNGQDVQRRSGNLLCPARSNKSFIGQTCLVKMDEYRARETSALSRENKITCFLRDLGFKCCCSKYLKVVIDGIFPSSSKYGKPTGWLWSKN